jgi:hypothetical protein
MSRVIVSERILGMLAAAFAAAARTRSSASFG